MGKWKGLTAILASLLLFACGSCFERKFFQSFPCSSPRLEMLLKAAPALEINRTNSVLQCAISCAQNSRCNFAVFRQSTHWCKHIFAYEGNPTTALPAYANDNDCVVLRKENKPICQNGGDFPGNAMCHCSDEYDGRECEYAKPGFCNSNSSREVDSGEYSTLVTSQLEVKLVITGTSTTTIHPIKFIGHASGYARFESHDFLSVSGSLDSFQEPLSRQFMFYAEATGILTTKRITMPGAVTTEEDSSVVFKSLISSVVDDSKLVFQPGVTENFDDLTDRLYKGHRKMTREPIRTAFDTDTGDVIYQETKLNVGASYTAFNIPIYFYSTKHCVRQNKVYVTRTTIATGASRGANYYIGRNIIELDRCWTKLSSVLCPKEMLSVLTEAVLILGREVRLIMAASVATDVTMVTITDSDVVAALSEYLTPNDIGTALGSYSKIRFSSLSLSKTLTECEMTFQGSTVHQIINGTYPSTLEWVVSSRVWVSKFVQAWTASGMEASGLHNDVYSAAVNGRSIRVCVEKTLHVSTCFTGVSLTLDDSNQHVMIQSPAALGVDLTPDRTFSGDVGPDCKRTVYLVSTKGWVKTASYVTGVADPLDAVVTLNFLKITWFQQS